MQAESLQKFPETHRDVFAYWKSIETEGKRTTLAKILITKGNEQNKRELSNGDKGIFEDFFNKATTLYQASKDLLTLFTIMEHSETKTWEVENFWENNLDNIKKNNSWDLMDFAKFLQKFEFNAPNKFNSVLQKYVERASSLTSDEDFKNKITTALTTFKESTQSNQPPS